MQSNRFNELDTVQQHLVNMLINAMAANRHVHSSILDRIVSTATGHIHDQGRAAMTPEDVQ